MIEGNIGEKYLGAQSKEATIGQHNVKDVL